LLLEHALGVAHRQRRALGERNGCRDEQQAVAPAIHYFFTYVVVSGPMPLISRIIPDFVAA